MSLVEKFIDAVGEAGSNLKVLMTRTATLELFSAIEAEAPPETLSEIAGRGANLKARDDLKMTPLALAAFNGNTPAVRELVRLGAKVDCRSGHQMTALMWAAAGGHTGTAEALLSLGADPAAKERAGRNAASFADVNGHADLAARLAAAAKKITQERQNFQRMTDRSR